jgi:DNA repair exonuclease SbcCD ATPase subunit
MEASRKAAEFGVELKVIERQLKELSGDNCPVCTAPLDEGAARNHIEGIKNKQAECKKLLGEANRKAQAITTEVEAARKRHQTKYKESSAASAALREVGELKKQIAKEEAQVEALKQRAETMREKAKQYVELARKELTAAQRKAAETNPYDAQLAEAKGKVKQYKDQLKLLESDAKEKRTALAHHEFWSRGFSNQGLPSFVLDSVMPFITERANHYLETLSDGDITINFSTQRELKSTKGEYRDEIDIQWDIEGLDDSYPPSGGQLKKMEIATDLGLMDLVATREGSHLDILMLDEVLDGLDNEGCQRVLLLLQNLRAVRGSIFVVSHEAEVAEVFEKAVFAVKHGGHTVLEHA